MSCAVLCALNGTTVASSISTVPAKETRKRRPAPRIFISSPELVKLSVLIATLSAKKTTKQVAAGSRLLVQGYGGVHNLLHVRLFRGPE
jgi:hypothetical protein